MDSNNQLIYKGFDIPEGAIIEPNPGKGKLNGEYTVYDSNKNVIGAYKVGWRTIKAAPAQEFKGR